jgi:amino acid transporter/nucleotide-binding universal stress UspA family protein
MLEPATHRPRNVGWARAGALLYGDWGTSKAYVIGAAFIAARFSSLPIIIAVCVLTGIVGWNYIIICRHFPDGGGVYSSAREQSRLVAVIGALMLVANLTVTAALSGWAAAIYFHVPKQFVMPAAMALILGVGAINYFGPKHTGALAVALALPMVAAVVLIIGMSVPHLTNANLEPSQFRFTEKWKAFVGVILALSGVESIANLTGVMKLDRGSTMEHPKVGRTAARAIWVVAIEVVFGTVLMGWAMLSLPKTLEPELEKRWEDMLNVLAEHYGTMTFGPVFGQVFGLVTGVIVGLLLLSAVNTAVGALIGLFYMLARDGEMPRPLLRLNSHGVPWVPLGIATALPLLVVVFSPDTISLMELYAIGVVGAITVNLGSCLLNKKKLQLSFWEFSFMLVTFITLFAIELTLAKTKPNALFFIVCILLGGLTLRAWSQKRAGFETVILTREQAAAIVKPEAVANLRPNLSPGQAILVAARGFTPVLRFALEEAKLRQGNLYVLYIKQLSVALPGPLSKGERPRWENDKQAAEIMYGVFDLAREAGVSALPVYAVSDNPAGTIVDIAATLGVDMLMLGAPHRNALAKLLRGDVVTEVAKSLPENIQLVIHG